MSDMMNSYQGDSSAKQKPYISVVHCFDCSERVRQGHGAISEIYEK